MRHPFNEGATFFKLAHLDVNVNCISKKGVVSLKQRPQNKSGLGIKNQNQRDRSRSGMRPSYARWCGWTA